MLGYVLIDLHGCHGAAHVRLQSRYPVLGDRKTRVIVRPRPDVVRGPRLKLAQRVRFLYLDKEERFFLIIFCNNNTIFFGQNCLYRGNFNEIQCNMKYLQNQHSLECLLLSSMRFERGGGKKMLGKINPRREEEKLRRKFAIFAEIFRISAAERINRHVRCNTINLSAQNIRCRHEYLLLAGRSNRIGRNTK